MPGVILFEMFSAVVKFASAVCQCVGWHNVSSELPEAGAEGTCRRQVLLYDLKNTETAFKGCTK